MPSIVSTFTSLFTQSICIDLMGNFVLETRIPLWAVRLIVSWRVGPKLQFDAKIKRRSFQLISYDFRPISADAIFVIGYFEDWKNITCHIKINKLNILFFQIAPCSWVSLQCGNRLKTRTIVREMANNKTKAELRLLSKETSSAFEKNS